jgi:uncharacterized linocin/CFP29 family protein
MAANNTQVPWTDDQWNRVRRVIREEARAARVAGNFLPLYGPLDADATTVSRELLRPPHYSAVDPTVDGFTVDDTTPLKLSTLQVKVFLESAQMDDPELRSALIAFRRAANVLAHLEDEIIFRGQLESNKGPEPNVGVSWQVGGGEKTPGLLAEYGAAPSVPSMATSVTPALGEQLVSAISGAVGTLESRHHVGPFACVLGPTYFQAVQTPNNSLVLPQDRILPFLGGGPLVRSSAVPEDVGVLIALGGAPVDLVLATDISVEFLQLTERAWFVFRVYEKMVLRINHEDAIERIAASSAPKIEGTP